MAPKHRLNPEELVVDSFETEGLKHEKGTVHAHESYPISDSTCFQIMCTCTYGGPGNGTCDYSCMGDPCEPTAINCYGCGGSAGCSGAETCGCPRTNEATCCTGFQAECSCWL